MGASRKGGIMQGYQLVFYTQQNHYHHHQPVGEWLMALVAELQLSGATLSTAQQGIGRSHHRHSAHFFDLVDQPVQVTVVVSTLECQKLLDRLAMEPDLNLFYVKMPVELGCLGTQGGAVRSA